MSNKKLKKWVGNMSNANRMNAALEVLKSQPSIAVDINDLDKDPWLLSCTNGTVELKGNPLLREHRREDLITKMLPAAYQANAECSTWLAFLQRIMNGNSGLINYLQRAIGYSLTGSTREHCLFLLYGDGRNGKSTLVETLLGLLAGYAKTTPFTTFIEQKNPDSARNDLADLHGARFVAAAEVNDGQKIDEATVKQMTGADTIKARHLYCDFFEYVPQFKIWLSMNHLPQIRGVDQGVWRRIRVIPFLVTIPEDEQDKDLKEKLRTEFDGILAWAIEGCIMWQQSGLQEPSEVREATSDYRSDMDIMANFIAGCCVLDKAHNTPAGQLYETYSGWCNANAEDPVKQRTFGLRLKAHGLKNIRGTGGVRLWQGIRLTSPGQPPPAPAGENEVSFL